MSEVKKNTLRTGTVAAGATLMLLLSSPAFAAGRDDGEQPGPGLSVVETLGLFVAAPIVLYLLIAGLVMVGSRGSKKHS
ncbi:hypothetical protein ACFPA8_04175 [Streptomyces ovatisporus]|uniref:Secreted protein n=1 Tax=Streptomyces ovatisporus TaxID=1128682 RepID=A0ABV9A0X9_9ACTN